MHVQTKYLPAPDPLLGSTSYVSIGQNVPVPHTHIEDQKPQCHSLNLLNEAESQGLFLNCGQTM